MKLETKRDFNEIAQEFKSDNFQIETVSKIIVYLRMHRKDLTAQEAKILLQIPINILDNDVDLKNKNRWQIDNASYFAGNIFGLGEEWKEKFYSKVYDLTDISELCKIVANNFDKHRGDCEFLLRNVEVTLRDDVTVNKCSNFYKSGNVFCNEILNVIK